MSSNVIPLIPETPTETRRVAPYEAGLIQRAEIKTAKVSRDWYRGSNALRAQINSLDHHLHDTLEAHAVLHQLHREHDFEAFQPKFPQSLYWLLLGLAVVLESPLNNSALSFTMMDDVETWMVALFLGALNVIGASFVGWKVRQAKWSLVGLRDWLMALLMVSVTVGTIFGLAGLRSDFLIMKAQETGLPASSATYVTFVTMQLLFFVTGIFFSYSMHPADATLERILKQTRELRRRTDALLHERATLAARHDRALGLAETALNELRADCLAGIAEYRDFNMASRGAPSPHWLRESLDHSIFRPVDFGSQIDPSPMSFDELVGRFSHKG